jgi:hypothetical protein
VININYITNEEGNKRYYFTIDSIKMLYERGFTNPLHWQVPYQKQYIWGKWWFESYHYEIYVKEGPETWQQVKQEKRFSFLYNKYKTREIGRISFKKPKIKKLKGLSIARPDSEIFEEY